MKKAHNRLRSVFTIFLLAVFCLALLPPITNAADLYPSPDELIQGEAEDVTDDHPWNEQSEPSDFGSSYMMVRLTALLMDAGILDIGGYTQLDSKSSNNCLKQDADESDDFNILK